MGLITAATVATVTGGVIAETTVAATIIAGAASVLASTALSTAVGFGIQAAFGPDKPDVDPIGIRSTLDTGGTNPRTIPFGRHGTAGSLEWANSWKSPTKKIDGWRHKKPNGFQTRVVTLSDLPVKGLNRVFVNGKWCTLVNPGPEADAMGLGQQVQEFDGEDGRPHLWVKFYDGTQTSADPFLQNHASNSRFTWDAGRIGYGTAYAIVTAYHKAEIFRGFPRVRFELDGMRLYDPTKDDTAGGSGPQRKDDPTTWGGDGDDLPAVQLLAIYRGIEDGFGNHLYGFQTILDAQLPMDKWRAAIDECRKLVDGKDGDEPQYLSGGEVRADTELGDVVEQLHTAMNARPIDDGFELFPVVGAAPSTAVATITDDDILVDSEQTFTPFFGIDETVNHVSGVHSSPAEGWTEKATPAVTDAAFQVEDGSRKLTEQVRMRMVYRDEQAQRQLLSALREARRARRHTFALPSAYHKVQPGDRLDFNSAARGYSAKGFRVDGVIALETADIVVDLTEIDPSDYSYTSANDYQPVSVAATAIRHPEVQDVTGWTVSASAVTDDVDGVRRPAILLGWDHFDGVEGVTWVVRNKATGKEQARGNVPTANGEEYARISGEGILPATTYEVRGRYQGDGSFPTDWTAWTEVTTWNVRHTYADLDDSVQDALDDGEQALIDAAANEADVSALETKQTRVEARIGSGVNLLDDPRFTTNGPTDAAHPSEFADSAGVGALVEAWGPQDDFDPPSARLDLLGGNTKPSQETLVLRLFGETSRQDVSSGGWVRVYPNDTMVARALVDLRNRFDMPENPFFEVRFKDASGANVDANQHQVDIDRNVTGWRGVVVYAPVPSAARWAFLHVGWDYWSSVSAPSGSDLGIKVFDAALERVSAAAAEARAYVASDLAALVTDDVQLARIVDKVYTAGGGTELGVERFLQSRVFDDGSGDVAAGFRDNGSGRVQLYTKRLSDGSENTSIQLAGDHIYLDGNTSVAGDFEVDGDVNVVDGSIKSNGMELKAATNQVFINSTGWWSNAEGDQWDDCISTNLDMLGGTDLIIKLKIRCWGWKTQTSEGNYTIRLQVDGGVIWQETYCEHDGGFTYSYNEADVVQTIPHTNDWSDHLIYDKWFKITGLPSGSRSVKVRFYANDYSGGSKNKCKAKDRTLWAVELRR
jgi:hypothetical protein